MKKMRYRRKEINLNIKFNSAETAIVIYTIPDEQVTTLGEYLFLYHLSNRENKRFFQTNN